MHITELARSGRSTCKKCKTAIAKDVLRLGKVFEANGSQMKHWYHVACWPVPKALSSLSDIEGWWTLSEAHKAEIISQAPNRAPPADAKPGDDHGGSASSAAAAAASSSATTAAAGAAPFAAFVALTEQLEAESSSLEKTAIIKRHLATLRTSEDRFLTSRLLLPGKKDDLRIYQLKDKSLVAILSSVLRCSESAMSQHLESSTDLGLTAEHFYASAPPQPPPGAPLTLTDVHHFLDDLSQPSASSHSLFSKLVPRATPAMLRVVTRLVRKDLRTNAGAAIVLKGIGGEAAYEHFKAAPDSLRAICDAAGGGGSAGASHGGGGGAGSSSAARGGGIISAGQPFKPQLADQCKSFELPLKKFPSGTPSPLKLEPSGCCTAVFTALRV